MYPFRKTISLRCVCWWCLCVCLLRLLLYSLNHPSFFHEKTTSSWRKKKAPGIFVYRGPVVSLKIPGVHRTNQGIHRTNQGIHRINQGIHRTNRDPSRKSARDWSSCKVSGTAHTSHAGYQTSCAFRWGDMGSGARGVFLHWQGLISILSLIVGVYIIHMYHHVPTMIPPLRHVKLQMVIVWLEQNDQIISKAEALRYLMLDTCHLRDKSSTL